MRVPSYSLSLEKVFSASPFAMLAGEDKPVSFTVNIGAVSSGAYFIGSDVAVKNTGEWPVPVPAVSDTVRHKAGGFAWLPATTSVTTAAHSVIPTGGPRVYPYSRSFTIPVSLSSGTPMSGLIEIAVGSYPDGTHLFNYRLSFPKPAAAVDTVLLRYIETIKPPRARPTPSTP